MKRRKFGIILLCIAAAVMMVIVLNSDRSEKNKESERQAYAKLLGEKEIAGQSKAVDLLSDIENGRINEKEFGELISDRYEEFTTCFERMKELSVDEQAQMLYDAAILFNMSEKASQKDDAGELKKTRLYSFSKDAHNFISEYTLGIDERKGKHPKNLSDDVKNLQIRIHGAISDINKNVEAEIQKYAQGVFTIAKRGS